MKWIKSLKVLLFVALLFFSNWVTYNISYFMDSVNCDRENLIEIPNR